MSKSDTAAIYLRMPARLKKRIQADVRARNKADGTTLNTTSFIVGLLAERYGVPYKPGNKRAKPTGGGRPKP